MKLFIKLVLLVSLPTFIIILFLYKNLNDQLVKEIEKQAIINKQKNIDRLLSQYNLTINNTINTVNLAAISSNKEFINDELYEKIIKFFKGIDALVKVTFISKKGIELISVEKQRVMLSTKDAFLFNKDAFQIPMIENYTYISKIYKDKNSDVLLIDMSKQVIDIKTGKTLGVVLLSFSLYDFQKTLSSKLLEYEGIAILDTSRNHFIYKSDKMKDLSVNLLTLEDSIYKYEKKHILLKSDYKNEQITIFSLVNNKSLYAFENQIIIDNMLLLIILLLSIFIILTIIIKKVLNPIDLLQNKIKNKLKKLKINNLISSKNEIDALDKYFLIYDNSIQEEKQKLENLNKNLNEKIKIEVENSRKKDLKLNQQSKMVSLGEMIGNIAHQWRQPLSVISTAASGLKLKNELEDLSKDELIEYSDLILKNTNYLSETINTFKNFINYDKNEDFYSVSQAIKISLEIVNSSLIQNNIKILAKYKDCEDIRIMMVVRELQEVLINIINNSKDAIISNKIENSWIKIDLEKNDTTATLSIEDNAGGIPEQLLERVFEPYFTTKHKSVGTGLGLHMSFKIVTESLHGEITVKNTKHGAKFCIYLPYNEE